jgi:hypothetical protein
VVQAGLGFVFPTHRDETAMDGAPDRSWMDKKQIPFGNDKQELISKN